VRRTRNAAFSIPLFALLCLAGCTASEITSRGGAAGGVSDLSYLPSEVNADARRRLYREVTFDGGSFTLVQIAQMIHTQTGVPVRFDWEGLEEIEVAHGTPIELVAGEARADKLLAMALFEAAPTAWNNHPTYLIIDGVAVVGTNRSLRQIAPQVNWPEDGPRIIDEDQYSQRLLDEQVVRCEFEAMPLDDLITYIADAGGLNIAVNWPALELVEIDREKPITISVSHITAGLLLELVLDQASAENFADDKAGYMVVDGIVYVSPLRELKTNTDTRIYDIRDLIDRPYGPMLETIYADDEVAWELLIRHELAWAIVVEQWRRRPIFDLNDALSGTNSGGSPLQSALEQHPEDIKPFSEREMLIEEIILLIQDTVGDPDEWLDEESTIRELNGNLVIKTTPGNHRDVESLLSRLRETRGFDRFMREVEVTKLLREAEALRTDGRHAEALEVVDRALDVDPGSGVARALQRVIADTLARRAARD